MSSPPLPDFAPRIHEDTPGSGQLYEDGRVYGDVESGLLPDGSRFLRIHEWTSREPSQGHTNEALTWLRERHKVITVVGAGSIEDGVGDIATFYWEHQYLKGLVDKILLDDGTVFQPEGHRDDWKSSVTRKTSAPRSKP